MIKNIYFSPSHFLALRVCWSRTNDTHLFFFFVAVPFRCLAVVHHRSTSQPESLFLPLKTKHHTVVYSATNCLTLFDCWIQWVRSSKGVYFSASGNCSCPTFNRRSEPILVITFLWTFPFIGFFTIVFVQFLKMCLPFQKPVENTEGIKNIYPTT